MLSQAGADFRSRDIFASPLTRGELLAIASRASVAQLFSWRSPSARQLAAYGARPPDMTDDRLIDLMLGEARLIRRPILVRRDRIVIGLDLPAIHDLLSETP